MKAEEFMIGDWVSPLGHPGVRVQVRPEDYVNLMEYEPIPLTPEILEKNGFKKHDMRVVEGQHEWSWWQDTLTLVSLWCRELEDNPEDGWMVNINSPYASCRCKVEYSHQLQHALRLCGIKKEIVL